MICGARKLVLKNKNNVYDEHVYIQRCCEFTSYEISIVILHFYITRRLAVYWKEEAKNLGFTPTSHISCPCYFAFFLFLPLLDKFYLLSSSFSSLSRIFGQQNHSHRLTPARINSWRTTLSNKRPMNYCNLVKDRQTLSIRFGQSDKAEIRSVMSYVAKLIKKI